MIKLENIKKDYIDGKLNKDEYIKKMHKMHECLFDYSNFISNTDIKKIEIFHNLVIITTTNLNTKFICDKYDQRSMPIEILNFNSYEEEILNFMLQLIEPNFTILDIGSNIGWYSINLSKACNNINIYAFEPMFKTFNYLIKNLKLNNITNVTPKNLALSDENKIVDFYYSEDCTVNASLKKLNDSYNLKKVTCESKKLDDFISEENIKVDFIKCDVEGAELLVYKGGIETLTKFKPIIFSEMLRKWSQRFSYHPNDIINLLIPLGYRCFTINNNILKEFHQMTDETLETNFVFLHSKKHLTIINKFMEV